MTPPPTGPGDPPPPNPPPPDPPPPDPPPPNPPSGRDPVFDLAVRFWVGAQRAWLRRFPGVAGIAGDGHYFLTLPPLALLAPVVVVVVSFWMGAGHVGFDTVWSENLAATAALLAVGALSGVLGVLGVTAMWLGDALLGTPWTMSDGVVAHLLEVRLPQLITYLLLAVGVLVVPRTGRALGTTIGRIRLLPGQLVWPVASLVVLVVTWIGTRTWAAAAPLLIRPRFTWNGGLPTVEAIAPLQEQGGVLVAAALVAVLVRQAWLGVIGLVPAADDMMVRAERHGRATTSGATSPADLHGTGSGPSTGRTVATAVVAAVLATLVLAGILEHWWLWVASLVVFLGLRLLRVLDLPGVRRWQALAARVPLVVRLVGIWVLARVVTNALSNDQIGSYTGLAMTVLVGAVLVWVVFPGHPPEHHADRSGDLDTHGRPRGRGSGGRGVAGPAVGVVALVLALQVTGARPAFADNCGTFLDCFNQSNAAAEAAFGLVLLSLILDFVPVVGTAKGWIETVTGRDLVTGEQLSAIERGLGVFGGWGDLLGLAARHGDEVAMMFGWGRHLDEWGDAVRRGEVPSRPRATAGAGSGRGSGGPGRGDGGGGGRGDRGGSGRDGDDGGRGDGDTGPGHGGDPNGRDLRDFDSDPPDGMTRDDWIDELSRDPAHSNRTSAKAAQEARVGLHAQETGQVPGPLRRDPTGGAEFIDADGRAWDVKSYNSNYRNGFNLDDIEADFETNLMTPNPEKYMVDTTNMSAEDVGRLRDLFARRDWSDYLVLYP